MGICEYIKNLLIDCPLLNGQVISIEFFDEKIGGVGIFENYENKIIRSYTDGERLLEKTARLVFSHTGGRGGESEQEQRAFAQDLCTYLNNISDLGGLDGMIADSIECECMGVSGSIGMQKCELECRIRFLERKGD